MLLCKDCKYQKVNSFVCSRSYINPCTGGEVSDIGCVDARWVEAYCGASGRGFEPKEEKKPRLMMKGCGNTDCPNHPVGQCGHFYDHEYIGSCTAAGPGCVGPCQPIDAAPQYPCPKCGRGMLQHEMVCQECYDAAPPEPQRPDPGEGWRLLEDGEIISENDQYQSDMDPAWRAAKDHGYQHHAMSGLFYRRRVEPVAQDCPLCGSKADVWEHRVVCGARCGLCVYARNGEKDCVAKWNRLALRR